MGMFAFLDWTLLATFTGAVALTVFIVQLLKLPMDKVWKIPTRFLVFFVCFAIMLAAQYFIGNSMSLSIIVMTLFNAVLGTLAAMALYEVVIALPEEKKLSAIYNYMQTGKIEEVELQEVPKDIPQNNDNTGGKPAEDST